MMDAITVWQPWGFAISDLGKPVENRSWAPPAGLVGRELAIHAGRKLDEAAVHELVALGHHVTFKDLVLGAVVCTVRLVAIVERDTRRPASAVGRPYYVIKDSSVSPERVHELLGRDGGIWYNGDVGWVLDEKRKLARPVHCRGAQRVWHLTAELERAVREEAEHAERTGRK
jgi:hypothetical protein